MAHVGDEALLNRPSSSIEQFCGYFLVLCMWVFKCDLTDSVVSCCFQAAFDHVVKNDLKMKVTCTYLQKYLEKHALPEYTSRIVE